MEDFAPIEDAEVDVKIADFSQPKPKPPAPAKQEVTGKKEKKRLRHFRWFITFNTNLRFKDREDPEMYKVISQLEDRMHEFGLAENLKKIIVFKKEGHAFTLEYIKKIQKIKGVVETGSTHDCVHTHFQLIISHYSCIQLDYTLTKQFFKEVFPKGHGLIKQYQTDQDVLDYIHKYVNGVDDLPEICSQKIGKAANSTENVPPTNSER